MSGKQTRWWQLQGLEVCPFCLQFYRHDEECRCPACDTALCPSCACGTIKLMDCPACASPGE